MLAVQPMAELEHAAVAVRECPEDPDERLPTKRDLSSLVRELRGLVRDEVAELGLLLVTDRLLQRDRSLRGPPDLLHLVRVQLELLGDLGRARRATELRPQLSPPADAVL